MLSERVLDFTEYFERISRMLKQQGSGSYRMKTIKEHLEESSADKKRHIYVTSSGTYEMKRGLTGVL